MREHQTGSWHPAYQSLLRATRSWSIWRGSRGDKPGDWRATRRAHRITPREISAGVYMTVDARTLDELAAVLDDQARIYELCATGGLAWVRVTDRLGRSTVAKETHRFRTCEAEELWLKILLGQAR